MVTNSNQLFEDLFDVDRASDWGPEWDITFSYLGDPDSKDFHVSSGVAHGEIGWASRAKNVDETTSGFQSTREDWAADVSPVPVITGDRWVARGVFDLQAAITSQINSFIMYLSDDGDESEIVYIQSYGPDIVGFLTPDGLKNGPFHIIFTYDSDNGWTYLVVDGAWPGGSHVIEFDRRVGDANRNTYIRIWPEADPRPSDATFSILNNGVAFGANPRLSVNGNTSWCPTSIGTITYVGAGTVDSGTGNISPGLPAGILPGDLMILAVETANESVSTPTGWTLSGSQLGTGTAGDSAATRLSLFYRYATGSDSAPAITDPGDHAVGRIFAWRNAILDTSQGTGTTGSTPTTSPSGSGGMTTDEDNEVYLVFLSASTDTNTSQISGWTNATTAGFAEISDDFSNTGSGNGGGFGLASGTVASSGTTIGTTTATFATSSRAVFLNRLLKPDYPREYDETFVIELSSVSAESVESIFQPYGRDLHILSIRASFTDDKLYNHALVVASGDKNQTYYGEVRDDDPSSPTNIADIGDRVFKYESDTIATQEAADQAAMKIFLDNCLISEDVDMENICLPMLDANDVIAVQELNFSELNQTFLVKSVSIPLSNSRQRIKFGRVISL